MAAGVASLVGSLLLPTILYFSPARTSVYQALHGEYRAHRELLAQLRDSLSQADMQIRMSDSTTAAALVEGQAGLWKKYGFVREETLRLAQSHASPSLGGLQSWLVGLWYLPFMMLVVLLPLCYWLLRRVEKPEANPPNPVGHDPLPEAKGAQPLSDAALFPGPDIIDPGWEETRFLNLPIIDNASDEEPSLEIQTAHPPELELSMEDEEAIPDAFEENDFDRAEGRKIEVLRLARKGMTSSAISRRLRMSQDQVEMIIRLKRDKG